MAIVRTKSQLGALIAQQRAAMGLTQAQLAARSGLRQATISAIEAGQGDARLSTLLALTSVLGVDLSLEERARGGASLADLF